MDFRNNPKLLCEFFEVRLKRTFAGDNQLRIRKFFLENCEGTKRCGHSFFWNQTTGLHELPTAINWRLSGNERKLAERNTSSINAQTFRWTAKVHQPFSQRS